MVYPDNISEKLGFSEIKAKVGDLCQSNMGRDRIDNLKFFTDFNELSQILKETLEFKTLLEADDPFPSTGYYPIQDFLNNIRTEGTYLEEEDLDRLLIAFRTIQAIFFYFKKSDEKYPLLKAYWADIEANPSLYTFIEKVLDETGHLRRDASKEYLDIHQKIETLEKEAYKAIQRIFGMAQKENWTGDGQLTIRNGRLCLPILAENKRKVKGFIQDESATGQTVYIEPAEVFELNNEIRDLEFHKRRERIKILIGIADNLRPNLELFHRYHFLLGVFDFLRAKALFAVETGSDMPKLNRTPYFKFFKARHPILEMNLNKEGRQIVPLDIESDEKNRIILVSGPNAGGKSVCLKTVGLLQMMIQYGFLIPASPVSEACLFDNIMVDIGDDQSMDSDLSTYSAHLTNMKVFLERASERTLVLIDEFGTGTDPQFGGPISEAVLYQLNQQKVKGVITTHYSNLKIFASTEEGIANASMLFDSVHLNPLFRFERGKPGSSYAFEIARKIGLPSNIIELAKEKIGAEQKKAEELLFELEKEKVALNTKQVEIHKMQRKYNFLVDENEKLKEYLESSKGKLIKDAKKEAESIILSANKIVEKTISDIKTGQAEKVITQNSRRRLKEALDKVSTENKNPLPLTRSIDEDIRIKEINAGDWVKIEGQETIGQVLSIEKEKAILAIGDLRSVIKINRLVKISKKEEKRIRSSGYQRTMIENNLEFSPELDVRGQRGEDALYQVEKYLDRALMLGISQFKIIHGKGDGILRKLIRENLRNYKQVAALENEHPDRGGDGITYVNLKG